MPPDLRKRFVQLLLNLPDWDADPRTRRSLLGSAIRGHKIWSNLNLTGSAIEAADHLLDLYDPHGPDPFSIILIGLRDSQTTNHNLCREIDWLRSKLRELSARRRHEVWHDGPPYLGLRNFDRKHPPFFLGRDTEVDDLIRTITSTDIGRRFCVVVGDSGSGKSSLFRAGV